MGGEGVRAVLLRRGESVRLPATEVRLEFRRGAGPGIPRAELCALLLADGAPGEAAAAVDSADTAAAPADIVSADAPRHGSAMVEHHREQDADGAVVDILTLGLESLGGDVTAVLLVLRAEGGAYGRIPLLRLRAVAEDRQPLRLECPGLAGGSAVVVGACYREGAAWRLRVVHEAAPPPVSAAPEPALRSPAVTEGRPPGGTPLGGGLLRVGFTPQGDAGEGWAELCALVELADGRKGVVQPLGGAYGSLRTPPYVRLDGPAGPEGVPAPGAWDQGLAVDLDRAAPLRRVLVFLALRAGSFTQLGGAVAVRPAGLPPADFDLAPAPAHSTACALLLLTREGDTLLLRREAHHLPAHPGLSPQRTVDYAYGWGLRWAAPSGS